MINELGYKGAEITTREQQTQRVNIQLFLFFDSGDNNMMAVLTVLGTDGLRVAR